VGKNVTKFKIGDYAGVGCLVDSCGECEYGKKGVKQYCEIRMLTCTSLDEAYRKVSAGEVKFRYVIDMSTLR
jgi:D-arabinose 1-dehydrogenase-like Zn-dependent alcohol dehydrogenase